MRTHGGKDLAVSTIEKIYVAGSDHLIDHDLYSKTQSRSLWCSCMAICFFSLFLIVLIYFTTMYFVKGEYRQDKSLKYKN